MLRLTGRTQIYLFILASQLMHLGLHFNIQIVPLCKSVCNLNSVKFWFIVVISLI